MKALDYSLPSAMKTARGEFVTWVNEKYRDADGDGDDGFIVNVFDAILDDMEDAEMGWFYDERVENARKKAGLPLTEDEALTAVWGNIAARIVKARNDFSAVNMGDDYVEGAVLDITASESDPDDAFLVDLCRAGVI